MTFDLFQLPYNQTEKINRLKMLVLVFGASDSREGLKTMKSYAAPLQDFKEKGGPSFSSLTYG